MARITSSPTALPWTSNARTTPPPVSMWQMSPSVSVTEARSRLFSPMKCANEGAFGLLVERLGRSDLLDLAIAEHGDAVGHHHGFLLIVGDVDDRDPRVRGGCGESRTASPRAGAGRAPPTALVHQHEFGFETPAPGAIATRCCWPPESSPGRRSSKPSQLDEPQCPGDPLASLPRRQSPHLQRKRQVSADGHVGEQRVVLEHDPDSALVRRQVVHGLAIDKDRPRGWLARTPPAS